jgi:flagellar biosynthesis/type III secretory pathway M-ring protein FliF/YscJ
MWNKLKQSLGLEKQQKVQAKPVAKAASEAQAAGAAKQSSAAKDPKEAAFDLERDAVRASFQSDPQKVVAVIRAWLHEDSKQAVAPKEDAKPK